jgi:signal transduction histidine kinase
MIPKIATATWWLLALAYPIWVVLGVVGWHGEPRIGVNAVPGTDGEVVVTKVYPGTPAFRAGVQAGDILVALDGVRVDEQSWRVKGDTGIEFSFIATRSGDVAPQLYRRDPQFNGALTGSFLTLSLVFAAVSFFIFARANRSNEILALSLFLIVSAIALAVAPATDRLHQWALHTEAIAVDWSAASFFVFFSLFHSRVKSRNGVGRILALAIVILTLTLDVLYAFTVAGMLAMYDWVRQLQFALLVIGYLGGVAYLVIIYLAGVPAVAREQVRIMALGIIAAVVPFAVLSIAPVAVGLSWVLRPELAVLASIFIPLSLGYAILRHQLMGIRRLVHRGAAYALISLAVLFIYGGLIAMLRVVSGPDVSSNLAVQIVLLSVLFTAVPFVSGTRRLAFAAVDRLLYQEYVDHAELARQVSIQAAYANHMDELATTVLGTIARELRLSFAAFIGVSSGRASVEASVGAIPKEFTQALGSPEIAGANGHSELLSQVAVQSCPGHAVLVKLRKSAKDAWILYLGPKVTEEPFQREDLELAQSIASHVATIVEKLELLDELRSKAAELRELNRRLVQAQETERARIASHIHDEPLQQITNLIWRHAGSGLTPEAQQELQRIAEDLRNFTARLHPALLEDLGLARALEWLGSEASAASGFKVIFNYEPIERYDRLSPETQLALYRIAQEALTNCRRHANASAVWVSLCREKDQINLVVEDDGIGFQQDKGFEPGKRLGLIGMRERAEQLGGHLRIMPRSPSGTKVVASLPIDGLLSLKGVNAREVSLDDQRFDR